MASKRRRIVNTTAGAVLADQAQVAGGFRQRLVGLLLSPPLQPGQGLLIDPCTSIHMFGMRFAIDAVFIDRNLRVVAVVEKLAPWRVSRYYAHARACLELPSGTICNTNTRVGDQIEFGDAE